MKQEVKEEISEQKKHYKYKHVIFSWEFANKISIHYYTI